MFTQAPIGHTAELNLQLPHSDLSEQNTRLVEAEPLCEARGEGHEGKVSPRLLPGAQCQPGLESWSQDQGTCTLLPVLSQICTRVDMGSGSGCGCEAPCDVGKSPEAAAPLFTGICDVGLEVAVRPTVSPSLNPAAGYVGGVCLCEGVCVWRGCVDVCVCCVYVKVCVWMCVCCVYVRGWVCVGYVGCEGVCGECSCVWGYGGVFGTQGCGCAWWWRRVRTACPWRSLGAVVVRSGCGLTEGKGPDVSSQHSNYACLAL